MAQTIYDDPAFFAGYAGLPRSIQGLEGAPEWPSLLALLPELRGRDVVDLGCGYGWFCRWAAAQGAASVLGLDLSARMLARARELTPEPAGIAYRQADLEALDLPEAGFDLAYSSLALHYIADLPGLLARLQAALRPGGAFVFSIEHPIFMASRQADWMEARGRRVWPVDSYAQEGPRQTDWLAPGVVKQHRMLGTTLTALIRAGFTLRHVQDWAPDAALLAARPELAQECDRPMFLLVAASREG